MSDGFDIKPRDLVYQLASMNQVTSFVNTVLDRFRHYMDEEGRNHVFKSWLKRRSEIRGMTRRVYFTVFSSRCVCKSWAVSL